MLPPSRLCDHFRPADSSGHRPPGGALRPRLSRFCVAVQIDVEVRVCFNLRPAWGRQDPLEGSEAKRQRATSTRQILPRAMGYPPWLAGNDASYLKLRAFHQAEGDGRTPAALVRETFCKRLEQQTLGDRHAVLPPGA